MSFRLLLWIFFLIPFKGIGQYFDKPVKSVDYLTLTTHYPDTNKSYQAPNLFNKGNTSHLLFSPQEDDSYGHLNRGPRLCLVGALSLLAASLVVHKNNNNLAIGLASAGVVTSTVGLVWYIKDQKRK